MLYMIFQYGLEPILIQRILIGFKSHTGKVVLTFPQPTAGQCSASWQRFQVPE